MLASERRRPGSTVAAEIRRREIEPYEWTDALLGFYAESDAFLFELIEWNRQRFKQSMRRWARQFLRQEADRLARPLTVLCHGDGLGIDAAAFALDGHRVTYFEFPGYSEAYARRAFEELGVEVEVVTDAEALKGRNFDAVTSFDVLEHVPEPRQSVAELTALLKSEGVLLAHAPFYLIHPAYPTHLRRNRRYAGSLQLYERSGLTLLDGQTAWNPLAFRKGSAVGQASSAKRMWLRTTALGLKVGRKTTLPFIPLQALLRRV